MGDRMSAQMRRSMAYKGPKSRCQCSHVGDGEDSQHEDGIVSPGHGACFVPECTCKRFSFAMHTQPFAEYMDALEPAGRKPRKARQSARVHTRG